ncbi:MAG: hypothetical protein ACOYKE_08295 [Ferruginibacter sp.]
MKIIPVILPQDETAFIQVAVNIYTNDPEWIRPLDNDIRKIFDPKQNKAFQFGTAMRWILINNQGKGIGRIAAFVHEKYTNKGDDIPVGGMGFFECINDVAAACLLFDTAKAWLQEKGMQAMDGPINFGERDQWWGLMVDGFYEPIYGLNYHPPYYLSLFTQYGFEVFYHQLCWKMPLDNSGPQLDEKFYKTHARFVSKKGYEARMVTHKDLDKYARDFCKVYNKAWAIHEGNKEMSETNAIRLFRSMKPILDETIAWFAYYQDEPIAMWLNIPDINQLIKPLNGQFNWWSKLKFLYYKKMGRCKRIIGLIYGVIPAYQRTGVDYYLIVEAEKVFKSKNRYTEIELLWQGDFNPKILNVSKQLGGAQSRQLSTMRYLFDRTKPFQRHPILN